LAGAGGLAARLGSALDELECNPVVVTPAGAVAVDARLLLRDAPPPVAAPPPAEFRKLFAPRTIAVAGVSTAKASFGNRALAAYRAFGWGAGLSVLHPSAREVDGVAASPSLAALPGGADYVLAALPAAACIELVRGARGRAGIVQVVSGGFGEAGPEGA